MIGRAAKRHRDGRIEIRLGEAEREILAHILGQLRDALLADPNDVVLRRLFPPAYPDDPEKEAVEETEETGEVNPPGLFPEGDPDTRTPA